MIQFAFSAVRFYLAFLVALVVVPTAAHAYRYTSVQPPAITTAWWAVGTLAVLTVLCVFGIDRKRHMVT